LVNANRQFFCTGFVIDGNYALTAAHCVVNEFGYIRNEDITIYSSMMENTGVTGRTVAIEQYRDVALIKGNFINFEAQKVDFYGRYVSRGVKMLSCGYPSGMFPKFCAELHHTGNRDFQYRTNGGPIFKGMSGGPVINIESDYAIGVNSAVDENSVIIGPLVGFLEAVGI
jgi:V8-like Glu-specific endopeptidase